MTVAEAVGKALAQLGVDHVFGVVGSGNFHVTNALVAGGARFVAARHEGGAATMADAYARTSGKLGVLSVHQGPGLTNAMTGITEAAKSGTPLIVLAAEATARRSNFFVDQASLATAVGAVPLRVRAESVYEDVARAVRLARENRTVLLNLPLDVQREPAAGTLPDLPVATRSPVDVTELASLLAKAQRPVFVAGRGSRHAAAELAELASHCGALLATSAVANGLFAGNPWSVGISGGFATPLAVELITGADLIVGFGCGLNMWTMRHGTLIGPDARVAQVDVNPDAIGAHRPVHVGVVGDVGAVAEALLDVVAPAPGYRTAEVAARLAKEGRWRDVPFTDESDGDRIDPRTLSIRLDDLLPADRVVGVDSGNFMGYPSGYLAVPDELGFCFTQAFQSIGLGLATTIGAALAQPHRLPVAALGDGGALMSIADLETVVRLGLPMVIVVYNDAGYGAEVHHFGPQGHVLDTVRFPDTDIAAIGRGFGCDGLTVRRPEDLTGLTAWLAGARDKPVVIDAKVTADHGSWWLEEAFQGH
ncbi:thiamine pyrophosphate-binding protein [Actinocrispum wychmicini]|uniref:Thiamine pyrophosphate-dependent acetolactate synthase large subunit-like protein n=1 Tax=Actinocrispum wychmicini TaxID=1213861 RepID=A0A4R2IT32_9PSEU|nr:thiamine pyrophosphate-binding protein [Actinocrispum wychmicini]TCO47409.1 thiamine pyrophosphate-dependent acetolactate synthase large subunit-like protein [Actinocrispum wychmicini]